MINPLVARLREKLSAAADPNFRAGQRRFFQHEVDTWGVRSPEVHALAREVYREVKTWPVSRRNALLTELLKSRKVEEGAMVCYVYRRFARECCAAEFRLFERWIHRYVDNWAACDGISSWLLAACLANEPRLVNELAGFTASPNRWKRRAAAVSLIQEAKQGRNTKAILKVAGRLIGDSDEMVQKGVGWLLKEAYPRQPRAVVAFLRMHPETPRRIVRYAAEKMSFADRAAVLERRRNSP